MPYSRQSNPAVVKEWCGLSRHDTQDTQDAEMDFCLVRASFLLSGNSCGLSGRNTQDRRDADLDFCLLSASVCKTQTHDGSYPHIGVIVVH